jgi:hypothetical protein
MIRRLRSGQLLSLISFLCVASASHVAFALNGLNALQFTPQTGWKGFELVTQGNDISAIADAGYGTTASRGSYDGLGAQLNNGVITIQVNNETTQGAVSRVDVDRTRLRQAIDSRVDGGATPFPASFVTGMGYAYQTIYAGNYNAITNPNPAATGTAAVATYSNTYFSRFCSGQYHAPNAFGPGRGLVDGMYGTGEEISGGQFLMLDVATRTFWDAPALGTGSWENAAFVDTDDTTHVALVLMSDVGSAPGDYIRMYVGTKGVDANNDGAIDFLERNGLRGGTIYYFDPDGAASTTTLPDGAVTGIWSASTTGALRETKLEDIDTNPFNGNQVVFSATNDGVYRMEVSLQFSGGVFDPAASATTITQLINDNGALAEPDNLDWARNGKIYMQEDGAGNEMFEMNSDGTGFLKIATMFTEPSGVLDVSELVGYQPGSVLLTSIQGSGGTSGAQLSAMISPYAAPLPASADFDQNGVVDGADFLILQRGMGAATNATLADGDANGNGVVDAADLAVWQAQFVAAPIAVVPEVSSACLAALALAALVQRRRPQE